MVGFLDAECIDVSEIKLDIATVTVNAMDILTTIQEKVMRKDQTAIPSDFITSPTHAAGPHKADLQNFEVTAEETEAFNKLCDKYADVFSDNSGDIGRTPLIKMDIDTRENPPVCQFELYLSSLNRGADECELEAGDVGRSIWGVKGQCGPGGSIGAVAVFSAEAASGN